MSLVLGPDGLKLTAAEHDRLNSLMLGVFGRGAGREILQYLRSITIEMVAGPNITDAELRHREGMRHLVAIIETRMKQGEGDGTRKRRKPAAGRSSTD